MVAQCFPGGESACVLSKDLLNLEPPLDNLGYALHHSCHTVTKSWKSGLLSAVSVGTKHNTSSYIQINKLMF